MKATESGSVDGSFGPFDEFVYFGRLLAILEQNPVCLPPCLFGGCYAPIHLFVDLQYTPCCADCSRI
ncbi:MAG: hypothetical protein Q7P63_00965 [Verrucomicrobiota bacterium JB022]|nr:hypothetical protein [Verrucomicrobiota bacterium JB022]